MCETSRVRRTRTRSTFGESYRCRNNRIWYSKTRLYATCLSKCTHNGFLRVSVVAWSKHSITTACAAAQRTVSQKKTPKPLAISSLTVLHANPVKGNVYTQITTQQTLVNQLSKKISHVTCHFCKLQCNKCCRLRVARKVVSSTFRIFF